MKSEALAAAYLMPSPSALVFSSRFLSTIRAIHAAQRKLRAQLDRAAELVDQEVYTPEYFVSRRQPDSQLAELDRALTKANARALTIDQECRGAPAMRPRLEHVIEAYPNAVTTQE